MVSSASSAMPVKVLFFGQCVQWTGKSEAMVMVHRPSKLIDLVRSTPELAPIFRRRKLVLVAVNEEFSSFAAQVRGGDEVAFMTSFSGG